MTTSNMKKTLLLMLIGLFSLVSFAQDSATDPSIFDEMDEFIQQKTEEETSGDMDAEVAVIEKNQELRLKISEYKMNSLKHREDVFGWQLYASKWIFVIVMLIVLSGLALSYMHFYKSLKAPAGAETERTELEMSTSGIKMNSSVIGLIILVLAIAFLYLYLVHVFPINEFNVDTKAIPGV